MDQYGSVTELVRDGNDLGAILESQREDEDLEISAEGLLLDAGVPKDLIDSKYIDLSGYKAHLLEDAGYMLASNKSGYIIRNAQEFTCEFTKAEQDGMTMQ